MKRYKIFILTSLVALGTPVLTACGSSPAASTEQKLVIVGDETVGLYEYVTLQAKLGDADCPVIWSSSDKDIATVSSSGMVKGMALGKAIIRAQSKENEKVAAEFQIEVRESMQIGLVLERFQSGRPYRVIASGEVNLTDANFVFSGEETYYRDSYFFDSVGDPYIESYGIGKSSSGCFVYHQDDRSVSDAELMRSECFDYRSVLYGVHDLSVSYFYSVTLKEDHTYAIEDSTLRDAFYSMLMQNIDRSAYAQEISSLARALTELKLVVKTPYSFELLYQFSSISGNLGSACLNFELLSEETTNQMLDAYLSSNEIAIPEVYQPILDLIELVSDHNYIRSLGMYTKTDGTRFSIGECHYTSDYVYFDFSEAYIEEMKESNEEYRDYGYVNIPQCASYEEGVYAFTYEENADGQMSVRIGARYEEKNARGEFYKKYYDFYENITWILEMTQEKLYTFQRTSTADYGQGYDEFIGDCSLTRQIASGLFTDLVDGLGATSEGLLLSMKIDPSDPSASFLNYGILISLSGASGYYYSPYPYTRFHQAGIGQMESFLESLK